MDQTPIADMKFEAALSELEVLVAHMEDDQLELDATIAAYRRSVALTKHCQTQPANAEKKFAYKKMANSRTLIRKPWRQHDDALC